MNKKIFIVFVSFLACIEAFAENSICYDEQNAFASTALKGWIADFNKGKELGGCVVYYVKGFTFDSSPAIFYPNLVKSGKANNPIQEIAELNGKKLKEKKSDIKIEKKSERINKNGLLFETRYFLEGPPPQEYEAVAYHAGKGNSVLIAVLSTRNKKDFDKYQNTLDEFVNTIRSVSGSELEEYKRKCGPRKSCK